MEQQISLSLSLLLLSSLFLWKNIIFTKILSHLKHWLTSTLKATPYISLLLWKANQVVPAWLQVLLQLVHWSSLGGCSTDPSPSTHLHDWKRRLYSGSGAKLAALGDRHSVGKDRHVSQLNLRSALLFVKYCLAELETLNWPKTILSLHPTFMGC